MTRGLEGGKNFAEVAARWGVMNTMEEVPAKLTNGDVRALVGVPRGRPRHENTKEGNCEQDALGDVLKESTVPGAALTLIGGAV